MNWLYLSLAILSEVVGTLLFKVSDGFARIVPTLVVICFYVLSYYFFNLSLKKMDLGTAYAVWSGLGTALLAGIGILFFNETFTIGRLVAILLIIAGVILLNLNGPKAAQI